MDAISSTAAKFPISPLDETLYTSQLVPFNPRSKIPETASSI